MTPREHMTFRLGEKGRTWIRETATRTGASESEVIRTALMVARNHEKELVAVLEGLR
jgi:Arc/MetJ-type ribon-helix-helix transcriptional regulator